MLNTALSTAFKKAGGNPNADLLYTLAANALSRAAMDIRRAIGPFVDEVRDAGGIMTELVPYAETRDLALAYLERVARDMQTPQTRDEGAQGPSDVQGYDRPSSPSAVHGSEGEGAHHPSRPSPFVVKAEDASDRRVPSIQPLARSSAPKRTLADRQAINAILSSSYFDSVQLLDGRKIGDLPWGTLGSLIGRTKYEAALLGLVHDYAVVSDMATKVREVVPLDKFALMVQKAASIADGE